MVSQTKNYGMVSERPMAAASALAMVFLLAGCTEHNEAVTVPTGWQLVDTGPFTFYAPPDLHKADTGGVAVDSFVGEFETKGLYVIFDYGPYSNSLQNPIDNDFRAHAEIVGGRPATLATFTVRNPSPLQRYKDMVAIYFGETGTKDKKLNMSAQCADKRNCQDAMDMFRSIRFAGRQKN